MIMTSFRRLRPQSHIFILYQLLAKRASFTMSPLLRHPRVYLTTDFDSRFTRDDPFGSDYSLRQPLEGENAGREKMLMDLA